ncbi:fungal hydrophobin-domain-containing protein [Suillus subalutaceus]|uniref:fungal hydrophobin-domain-containing protein n=1 Tax=Suillus subalutaceus TaxID=48586 RepID=UPI001B8791F3|nr:fungal hydrophobin-domain-containing protein [Suillus subalutaceus]KAG1867282.1 fungal hydrophobin-domain-containing protein [Suillus subalutaceus]
MFIRLLSITSLCLLAIANPLARRQTSSQCDTGNIQCCQGTQTADEYNKNATAHGGIPIDIDILGRVGLSCTPISVVGTGAGATCSQEPLCCSDNQYYGLVNIGCTPININI